MKVFTQIIVVSIIMMYGTLFMLSCTEDLSSDKYEPGTGSIIKKTNTEIKKEFGAALAKVLAESTPVRELIKKEALKKIDYDYDVLYLMVKDEVLSDNTTLEGLLSKYLNKEFFHLIENQISNLTIFVPELPDDSFSAELWDVKTDIPDVAIRIFDQEGIPAYNIRKGEYIIDAVEVPRYPIVVIKENERIVGGNVHVKSSGGQGGIIKTRSNSDVAFSFIDDAFNNLDNKKNTVVLKNREDPSNIHNYKKVKEACDIYENIDGWQRDYIYYDLKPETGIPRDSVKGPFIYKFKECLVGFELLGNPETALAKISDQTGDPQKGKGRNEWTEGEFEFLVKICLGSTSLVGSELKTYFRASGNDLFSEGTGSGHGTKPVMGLKMKDIKLPLFEWNLEDYATSVKIGIEEVDNTESIKNTQSTTVEFAGNISFDISWGKTVKKGLKFGASAKKVHTIGYEITTTKGNDELGEVIVNFGDPIMKKESFTDPRTGIVETKYVLNSKYSTGWYRLYIAPEEM
jgi:hypothetical protein